MTSNRIWVPLACFVIGFGCRSEPLEFPEWALPVPAEAQIIGLAPVGSEQRSERLDLQRDLVLTEAFGVPLYQPRSVGVAPDGRIFVLDAGNHRVVVFDPAGEPLAAFGRSGEGPGEFQRPWYLAVTGEQVIVHDINTRRVSFFDLDGNLFSEQAPEGTFQPQAILAHGDDLIVANAHPVFLIPGVPEAPSAPWIVGPHSRSLELISAALELTSTATTYWARDRTIGSVPLRVGHPIAAIAADGTIYATAGQEYQVLALEPDGSVHWALRVAYTPPAPSEELKQTVLANWQKDVPELVYDNFVWPEHLAAIENLEVDSTGRLYVFPHADRGVAEAYETHEPVPVDVYAESGARVFAGWSAIEGWDAALDEHVYRIETDADSGEQVAARYRLRLGSS